MRSLDAAWEADPLEVRLEGEEALAYLRDRFPEDDPYLRDRFPEDDPFRRDFELGLALGYKMSLKVRSELHEAS